VNQEFKQCLENKKIIPFARGKNLVKKELSVAKGDLSDAKAGYENERYKWSTIQAYYAMFHAARALIYSQGYREKSHYCYVAPVGAISSMPGEALSRRSAKSSKGPVFTRLSFLRKQESMLDSPHTSLDSRLRGNDMNSWANLCNQALLPGCSFEGAICG